MALSNQQQLIVAGLSVFFGFGLGLFYTLFRVFRALVPCGKVTVFFQDMIYFFVSAVLAFGFILICNDGAVRLYELLAFVLGWLVCHYTLGRGVVLLAAALRSAFGRLWDRRRARRASAGKKKKGNV